MMVARSWGEEFMIQQQEVKGSVRYPGGTSSNRDQRSNTDFPWDTSGGMAVAGLPKVGYLLLEAMSISILPE